MDSKTTMLSRLYTIPFIIIGHFLIFNIFIGVNIMNIHEANENFHEQVYLRKPFDMVLFPVLDLSFVKQVIAEKEATLARKKEAILLSQHEGVR